MHFMLETLLPAADTPEEAHSKPFVASMGMYVIKRKVLQELLSTRFPRVSGQQEIDLQ
jgi:ADP-glucose pyrophosphorylase